MEPSSYMDRGWAWVILLASFLSMVVHSLLYYGAGIIHVELLHQFKESDSYTSVASSLYSSLNLFIGPLTTTLIGTFGCRITLSIAAITAFVGFGASFFVENLATMIVTYALIGGTGTSIVAILPYVASGYYFEQRRNIAMGVIAFGGSVGMLISGPLFLAMFHFFGFHGAFLFMAALGFQQLVFAALMRPSEKEVMEKVTRKEEKHNYFIKDVICLKGLRETSYVLFLCQYMLWNFSFSLLFIHLPNIANKEGFSEQQGAFLVFLVGVGGTVSRLLVGLSVGPNGIDPLLMNLGVEGILGLVSILFPLFSHSYVGLGIFACVFGFYTGSLITLTVPVLIELLGPDNLNMALGTLYFTGGFGFIFGPILAGFIIDIGGSYEQSFILCGISYLLAMFVTFFCSMYRRKKEDRSLQVDSHVSNLQSLVSLSYSGILAGSMIIYDATDKGENDNANSASLLKQKDADEDDKFEGCEEDHISHSSCATPLNI